MLGATNSKLALPALVIALGLLSSHARAQDDPLQDPDFIAAQKEAKKLHETNGAPKMSDLKKQADAALAEQEQGEEKEKAALQKQLAAPGPVAFPGWTPVTPQFKADAAPKKKIDNGEVKLVQAGTSPLPPKQVLKAWETAVANKPLNHVNNDVSSNGSVTMRLFVSSREDPVQEVRLEASRDPGEKVTHITISMALPKPDDADE